MPSYSKRDVEMMKRQGLVPITLGAKIVGVSRAAIDKAVQKGKIKHLEFKGVKWVIIQSLKRYYGIE